MKLGNITVPETLDHGRFSVGKVLGQGGMALVVVAHDDELGVDRAVKILDVSRPNSATQRRRLRFEAWTMGRLHHPNILSIHRVGNEGDLDYVVMDLAQGGSLQDALNSSGPLLAATAIQYMIQTLSALAFAHASGVVHRDIKPQNILLDSEGSVLLADFGIAMTAGDDREGRIGAATGSIAFMPPEQRFDAGGVGPPADLYATGTTLFNLITGENPVDLFLATDRSERWSAVPQPLRPVLRRACAMRPDDRWGSASAMAHALLEVLHADDVTPTAPTARALAALHELAAKG